MKKNTRYRFNRTFRKGGTKMPKSLGAAKPLPSREDHFSTMVDETNGGTSNIQYKIIMLAISKALRRFVPPFHAASMHIRTLNGAVT
jgi:hypothetical protein